MVEIKTESCKLNKYSAKLDDEIFNTPNGIGWTATQWLYHHISPNFRFGNSPNFILFRLHFERQFKKVLLDDGLYYLYTFDIHNHLHPSHVYADPPPCEGVVNDYVRQKCTSRLIFEGFIL